MVRKNRSDKKDTTCKRCGKILATSQKLRDHLDRKFPCKPRIVNQKTIQEPIQAPFQTSIQETRHDPKAIPITPALPKKEEQAPVPILGRDYITNEEAKKWVDPNARKPGEHFRTWGARLLRRCKELNLEDYSRPENLNECMLLCHDLKQIDPRATRLPTKEEYEVNPSTQTNEELEGLGSNTVRKKQSIEFREQEELSTALKRRAVAVYRAKVPLDHPDNGSDIQKMLESQRKKFREMLEKEFDRRGQFKFALCSLINFLIDDKPVAKKAEKDKDKDQCTDWLRNKQIIVYNRSEIDNYLSEAYEQILNQVEERGGVSDI